ncbi:MAG: clan AA aspartic protease [Chloroflexota bacterium]|nr:clan AA aspartic protease [Chloroflexota bacterium]
MIEGAVNAAHEAVVGLRVQGPSGRTRDLRAVVDTGFSRFLTLPPAIVAELGLAFTGIDRFFLADGSEVTLHVYAVTVLWDGQPRDVDALVADSTPLAGMLLLDGHRLCVDVEDGGRVVIEPTARG